MVTGPQEGVEVFTEFVRGLVMTALHGGFFNRAVHALDLAVGPGMGRLGRAVGCPDTVNVALARIMLSAGIRIERFNLMLMVGPSKNIQVPNHESLVVSLLKPNRARELFYFENYTAFSKAHHKGVEPLAATPYTTVALDKALNLMAKKTLTRLVYRISTIPDQSRETGH